MRQAEAPMGDEEILFTDGEIYEQGRYLVNDRRRGGNAEVMTDRQQNTRIMRNVPGYEMEDESEASLYVVGQNTQM